MVRSYVPGTEQPPPVEWRPPPPGRYPNGSLHLHDGDRRPILLRSFTRKQMPLPHDEEFSRFAVAHVKSNTWEGYFRNGEKYNGKHWNDRRVDATKFAQRQLRLYASKINELHQEFVREATTDGFRHCSDGTSYRVFEYGEEGEGILIGPKKLAELDQFAESLQHCFGCFHREFLVHPTSLEMNGYVPGPLFCPCSPRLIKWRYDEKLSKFTPECSRGGLGSIRELLEHCRDKFDVNQRHNACPFHFAIYSFLVYLFSHHFPIWDHPIYQGIRVNKDRQYRRQAAVSVLPGATGAICQPCGNEAGSVPHQQENRFKREPVRLSPGPLRNNGPHSRIKDEKPLVDTQPAVSLSHNPLPAAEFAPNPNTDGRKGAIPTSSLPIARRVTVSPQPSFAPNQAREQAAGFISASTLIPDGGHTTSKHHGRKRAANPYVKAHQAKRNKVEASHVSSSAIAPCALAETPYDPANNSQDSACSLTLHKYTDDDLRLIASMELEARSQGKENTKQTMPNGVSTVVSVPAPTLGCHRPLLKQPTEPAKLVAFRHTQ